MFRRINNHKDESSETRLFLPFPSANSVARQPYSRTYYSLLILDVALFHMDVI